MKKTKLIIAVMAIVLLCACLFAGCKDKNAGSNEPDTFFVQSEYESEEFPLFAAATKVAALDGYAHVEGRTVEFGAYKKTNDGLTTYLVYDLTTESVVATYTPADETVEYDVDTGFVYSNEKFHYFYVVRKEVTDIEEETVTATETLYDQKGNFVYEYKDPEYVFDFDMNEDLIYFGDKVFRVADDGSIKMIRGENEMQGAIPHFSTKFGDYYYNFDNDTKVIIYDKDFAIKAYYTLPSYISDRYQIFFVLNNGNVFVQYLIEKAETENDYDFVTNGKRYVLRQQLISAADGSVKDVNLGSVVFAGYSRTDLENFRLNGINKKYDNFVELLPIVERQLATSYYEEKFVALSDELEVMEELNGLYMQYEAPGAWETVATDRVVVEDRAGRNYLLTFDGTLIGEVANNSRFLSKYILTNTSIYDYNLRKLIDYDNEGYTYTNQQIGEALVFTKTVDETNKRYLFVDGQMILVADGEFEILCNDAFIVRVVADETVSYNLYNAAGTKIATFSSRPNFVDEVEGKKVLLSALNAEGVKEYYILK